MIEMLVSLAITMIMMLGVVTLFGVMTDSISGSRALLETGDRLRACRNRLQADLQAATATMLPPLRPENDEGYFEIGEGQYFDSPLNNGLNILFPPPQGASLFGDTDDYLAFTVRSRGEPFLGKYGAVTIESQAAEVVYFLTQSGNEPIIDATQATPTRLYTLYRRVRLIAPAATGVTLADDISSRPAGVGRAPNTLGDTTKPENRFNHSTAVFPFRMILPFTTLPLGGARTGDDILLTNVVAFDVQVYDPGAPLFTTAAAPTVILEPRDQGYAIAGAPVAFGAYVDLGYAPGYSASGLNPKPLFNSFPDPKSGIIPPRTATNPYAYDTWSLHYENNGINEDGIFGADSGTNGLDDNANGVVDELLEYDTLPPYSAQLRGIRILVRVYEPSSQQVREIIVTQDFMP